MHVEHPVLRRTWRIWRPLSEPRGGRLSAWSRLYGQVAVLGVALAVGLTLAAVAAAPSRLVYRNTPLHAAVWTAAGFAAVAAAQLLFVRFADDSSLPYLLAGAGLAVIGVADIAFAVSSSQPATRSLTWSPVLAELTGTLLLAAAALTPALRVVPGRLVAVLVGGVAGYVVLLVCLSWFASAGLTVPRDPDFPPALGLSAPSSILGLRVATTAALALAAVGFFHYAESRRDELLLWLGAGAIIGCVGRLDDLIISSGGTTWILTNDLLRLLFFSFVIAGGLRAVAAHRVREQAAAVALERERIARDIHDGIAQELAFIALEARLVRDGAADEAWTTRIVDAAERALDECRRSMKVLFEDEAPGVAAVVSAAREVSERAGLQLAVEVDERVDLSERQVEVLARIVQEATSNAVRHGGAHRLVLVVRQQARGSLFSLSDDGCGFDLATLRLRSGYGLSGMQKRAGEVGGQLRVESVPARGTMIEVTFP